MTTWGELNQREGEKGNRGDARSQCWLENTNMTDFTQVIGYLQSKKSDEHLPQSPFTGQFLRRRHFALTSISLIFLRLFRKGVPTGEGLREEDERGRAQSWTKCMRRGSGRWGRGRVKVGGVRAAEA
jgi:hypothetical protein